MPDKSIFAMKDEAKTKGQLIEELAALRERCTKDDSEDYHDIGTAVNALLHLSLEDYSLEELLQKALDIILSVPSLSVEKKGCILLVEDEPGVLMQKVQRGLAEPLLRECARVPFGKCICGRAASIKRIEFTDHIDEHHEVRYEGMVPHGHYCVPILLSGNTTGVINLYLKEGHGRVAWEEEFLDSVANTLAGIIKRRHVEEEQRRRQVSAERLAAEMAIIAEIGRLIGETLNIEEVYDRIAEKAKILIPFERIVVNLYKPQEDVWYVAYVSGEGVLSRRQGDYLPQAGSISESVMRTRTGVLLHPASLEEMISLFPTPGATASYRAGMRSFISIPLISRDEVIGALHFRSKKPNVYTDQDLHLAERIGGQIAGVIANAKLFADLKRVETELQEAHDKLTLLLNSISSILIAVSEDNRIVFWNTEAEKQFGIPEKEILGKPLRELSIQWDSDQIAEGIAQCRMKNNAVRLDNVKFLQPDGKEGILGIGISLSFGEKSSGMVTLIQGANVTRRRMMENQLHQAQKLESIGQLAAGIAHEINTPIQYVGDNVRFLQTSCEAISKVLMKYEALMERVREGKDCDDLLGEVEETVQEADLGYLNEEIPRAFQQTLDGVERVCRIVQSMKAFAHPGTEEKGSVDINKAIENTIAVARNEWKYVTDLVTDLDPSLPLVSCVPGDINQVILNVLVNAAQAISEVVSGGADGKGKISISTRHDGTWVEIRVSDTGNGIPVEIRSRVFDPFFTTKEVGKGTGQGLAISHTAIVERHHGSITFDTEIGQGTTFIIRLPIKEPTDAGNQEP